MLDIKDLYVSVSGIQILNGINLKINKGEIHAIMGPNGSGKSTLSNVIVGEKTYKVTNGDILFENKSILNLDPTDRALNGIFLCFQNPVSISGINNSYFLKTALNAKRKFLGMKELDIIDFARLIEKKMTLLKMDKKLLKRPLNEGFSGGEKKRNEILQMSILDPKLSILDEMDSGLDIDALKIVSNNIRKLKDNKKSMLIITHYHSLLDVIKPDKIHILFNGKIIAIGNRTLLKRIEKEGFNSIANQKKIGNLSALC